MTRRVVVTGVGLITPIGKTVEETWTGLMSGRNGADYIRKFDAEKFACRFACEIQDFDPRVGCYFDIAWLDIPMRDSFQMRRL